MRLEGVFLPIITPFFDDRFDIQSYKKLINYYIEKGIDGIIPLATTGEYPAINQKEFYLIIEKTIDFVQGRIPIYIGLSSNNTRELIEKIKKMQKYKIQGTLTVSPYYNLPNQKGIYEHFLRLSEATDLDIIIYNIPYRTGRNIENDTIRKLAELNSIIGIKDSCGMIEQTMDLVLNPIDNFSILTGHDTHYYLSLILGCDGGILASAHLNTDKYISIFKHIKNNNHKNALKEWKEIIKIIPYLFQEPNPGPIKYLLADIGLIRSSEVRLPLVDISQDLKEKLLLNISEKR